MRRAKRLSTSISASNELSVPRIDLLARGLRNKENVGRCAQIWRELAAD
jgi:uncharacterized protein (DUF2237 family)